MEILLFLAVMIAMPLAILMILVFILFGWMMWKIIKSASGF